MRIGIGALNMQSAAGHAKAGISRYCTGLIEGLRDLNSEHEFVVMTGPTFEVPEAWRNDARLMFPKAEGPFLGNKMLRELLIGPTWLRRFHLDAYLSTAHGTPAWGRTRRGIVVHDLFPATHPEMFSRKDALSIARINAWAMRKSEVVIANSRHTAGEIERLYGLKAPKVCVVPLALGNLESPVEPSQVPNEELLRIGVPFEKYIFTIGTLEPRKNLPRLIEAFAEIASAHPQLGLAIAGAKGWKDHSIATTVTRLGIEDRVAFLGYVADADLPKLFARSEFFVCASIVEGFGIPVLEAHAFGAPVVTSSGGALAEVADPRSIFFDPMDVLSIKTALNKSLALGNERSDRVASGKQHATLYSWKATAQQTLDALLG